MNIFAFEDFVKEEMERVFKEALQKRPSGSTEFWSGYTRGLRDGVDLTLERLKTRLGHISVVDYIERYISSYQKPSASNDYIEGFSEVVEMVLYYLDEVDDTVNEETTKKLSEYIERGLEELRELSEKSEEFEAGYKRAGQAILELIEKYRKEYCSD